MSDTQPVLMDDTLIERWVDSSSTLLYDVSIDRLVAAIPEYQVEEKLKEVCSDYQQCIAKLENERVDLMKGMAGTYFRGYADSEAKKNDLACELQDALDGMRGIAKDRLARIAELEQRVAELEQEGEWEPVIYSTFIDDDSHDESYLLVTLGGTQLEIGTDPTNDGVTVNLPSDYRLCRRTRPATAQEARNE